MKKKYKVGISTTSSGEDVYLLYRKATKKEPRCLVISQMNTFDAIDSAHQLVGHLKVAPTWIQVKEKYPNISLDLVKLFVRLCPVCGTKNPTFKASKGARKPIISKHY